MLPMLQLSDVHEIRLALRRGIIRADLGLLQSAPPSRTPVPGGGSYIPADLR